MTRTQWILRAVLVLTVSIPSGAAHAQTLEQFPLKLWNYKDPQDSTVVVIPYILHPHIAQDKDAVDAINAAFEDYKKFTCVRFVPRTSEPNYLRFTSGLGVSGPSGECFSYFGMSKGGQDFNLDPGCRQKGIILHAMNHALGLLHEHARPDRDKFVTVNVQKIVPDQRGQFIKAPANYIPHTLPYDYNSIMHWPSIVHSIDGSPTIVPKDRSAQIGQRKALSKLDIQKINAMYKCSPASPAP